MTLRRISVSIAAVAAIICIAIPAMASAKSTHKVSLVLNGPAKGTTIVGTWSEKSLGKGTLRGTLHIPVTILTFTAKGGTFTTTTAVPCKSQTLTLPTFTGCWKVTKGTGRFKGISGGGTLFGNLNGHVTYKGKLTF